LVRLDFSKREVDVLDFFHLTGNEEQDFGRIAQGFEGVVGRVPGNAAPIRLSTRRSHARE
jgi:hypothetical protein